MKFPEIVEKSPNLFFARSVTEEELRKRLNLKFVQQQICKKADIRVTLVDNYVSAVRITSLTSDVLDYRRIFPKLRYNDVTLPDSIIGAILKLTNKMNLRYAAIDMVEHKHSSDFYFLEINATGQFGWLEATSNQGGNSNFSKYLAKALSNELF